MLGTVNGYYGSYLIFFYSIFSQKKKVIFNKELDKSVWVFSSFRKLT